MIVAVLEGSLHYTNAGMNGETDFYWTARKMLPTILSRQKSPSDVKETNTAYFPVNGGYSSDIKEM